MFKIEEYLQSDNFEMAQLGLEMLKLQEKDIDRIRIILEICLNNRFYALYSGVEPQLNEKSHYPLSSYSFQVVDYSDTEENIKYARSNKTIPSL